MVSCRARHHRRMANGIWKKLFQSFLSSILMVIGKGSLLYCKIIKTVLLIQIKLNLDISLHAFYVKTVYLQKVPYSWKSKRWIKTQKYPSRAILSNSPSANFQKRPAKTMWSTESEHRRGCFRNLQKTSERLPFYESYEKTSAEIIEEKPYQCLVSFTDR